MPGTYRKRGSDSYLLEVCIGTDFTGKPIRYNKTVHCKSNKEADKELAKFYTECEAGNISKSSKMTICALCDLYLKEYAEINLKKSTLRSTRVTIQTAIKPFFGLKRISSIKRLDVQQWVNELYKPNANNSTSARSPKTVRNYFSVFRTILQFAVVMDIIPNNPCKDIMLPKQEHIEATYYNREEVEALLICLNKLSEEHLKFKVAIFIALFGGLRKGEILGLNWSDVDWETSEIKVQRTRLVNKGHGVYEDTPKTNKSNRIISLPTEVISLLKDLKLQQKKEQIRLGSVWIESPAILRGEFGQPMYPSVLHRWFVNFLERNCLKKIGLHGLRHTHTSMLAFLQKDTSQISKRLGHSQLSTTLNIYTHLFEETDRSIAEDLSATFINKNA